MAWPGAARSGATRGNNDHLAEQCEDEGCPRLPCRMFKEGYRKGYDRGYADGYAAGYAAGYSAGYGAGVATCAGG
jgi:flagellar biosynthesis/type III secretory pathway protein FliH